MTWILEKIHILLNQGSLHEKYIWDLKDRVRKLEEELAQLKNANSKEN